MSTLRERNELRRLVGMIVESIVTEEKKDADDKFMKGSFDAQVDKRLSIIAKEAAKRYDALDQMPSLPGEGDDEKQPDDKSKPAAKELDVGAFAASVFELIDNFTNVVEIENTVYRRALRLLKQAYGDDAVVSFKEALSEHGTTIGKSRDQHDAEEYQAPAAAGAGPGGGGSVG